MCDAALGLLRSASLLKNIVLDERKSFEKKVKAVYPFLRRFNARQGVSSGSLTSFLLYGDVLSLQNSLGHFASDFDDWCRCLHKMSLLSVEWLARRLRALQRKRTPYAAMVHNLARSVYVCLIYWCVEPSVLREMSRRASIGDRACMDALTVPEVCGGASWCTCGPRSSPIGDTFSKSYELLFTRPLPVRSCLYRSLVSLMERLHAECRRRRARLGHRLSSNVERESR